MRRRVGVFLLVVLSASWIAFADGGAAYAAESRSFDAVLSLTGDCTVETVDPVPDPGCPGGTHPPAGPFAVPKSAAIDAYGDIYVASFGDETENGRDGHIDVFDSSGHYLTEIVDPSGPTNLAVDAEGNLYVHNFRAPLSVGEEEIHEIVRYAPSVYHPASGEIAYGPGPVLVDPRAGNSACSLAVDPDNGHLFSYCGSYVAEYSSAAEGNVVLDESLGAGELHSPSGTGLAVDAVNGRVYVNDGEVISVYELDAPHAKLQTIGRTATPAGGNFSTAQSVAVDESTGHVFIYDADSTEAVYEFSEGGTYLSTITHGIKRTFGAGITVDNGAHSPNGALNPNGRYLFVPSAGTKVGHVFAFSANAAECAPEVSAASFGNATSSEVELSGAVNPCNAQGSYVFQYTPESTYEEAGFVGAAVAGQGSLPAGGSPIAVNASATGLEPGSAYRFRLTATNAIGSDVAEGHFSTYPAESAVTGCPNAALRAGASSLLPDCRAYELVTPPATNARAPLGVGHLGTYFATLQGAPDGGSVSFEIEGGSIPGVGADEGTGSFAGDPYLATRGADGWVTSYVGPSAAESPALLPGSHSFDQGWSFWSTAGREGSAAVGGPETSYLRGPDGTSELIGTGSLGTEPRALGNLIGEGGSHVIFSTSTFDGRPARKLEPDAPPSGTPAIYDRTGDATHVVSLLPGDITPGAGEEAVYLGASQNGRGVAFTIKPGGGEGPLYLRYDDRATYEIGTGVEFAGVVDGGGRIFYLEGGVLFAFDVATESVIRFASGGDVTVVNVSADGNTAYLVSPTVLTKVPNAAGQKAKAGKQNLYRSEEGAISFVGTVTARDVEGENGGNEVVDGLGLWTAAVGRTHSGPAGRLGADPSRSTPDGGYLLFESRAALGPYDPDGHAEVYLYDSEDAEVSCLSCMPTGAPAAGNASLESVSQEQGAPQPFSAYALVENLAADGQRAFFQSTEALVPGDTDGVQDVYEWEADGVGSCGRSDGCVYLISSGHSAHADYLFAVGEDGADVFFRSGDILLGGDEESTDSIYDARVDGGFPEVGGAAECQGEGCRPALTPAPVLPTPAPPAAGGVNDNVAPKRCPKGKRRERRHGHLRCVERRPRKRAPNRISGKKVRHRRATGRKGEGR